MLGAVLDGGEMVARQLAHLASDNRGAVRKQDLGFADAARIQQQVSGRGVARVVLVAEVEVEVAERNPGCLSAPACLDEACLEREHGGELRASLGGARAGLQASPRAEDRRPQSVFSPRRRS